MRIQILTFAVSLLVFLRPSLAAPQVISEASDPTTFLANEVEPRFSQKTVIVNSLLGSDDLLANVGICSYSVTENGTTLFSDEQGRKYRLPPDELPPAADPSDFHANPLVSAPGLSVASQSRILQFLARPLGAQYAESLPETSYAIQVRPGVYYDTGAFESTPTRFVPGSIALDGSAEARRRGNIVFSDFTSFGDDLRSIPIRAQLNNTFEGLMGTDVLQAYVDAFFPGTGQFAGRSYFARAFTGDYGLLIGKAETAFGDLGSAPMLVANGSLPIGAPGIVNSEFALSSVNQLRLTRLWQDQTVETTLTLEDTSSVGDINASGQDLHDWPAFVCRGRYSPNRFDSLQIAAMYRPMGFIDSNFVEQSVHGWGLSLVGRKSNDDMTRAIYFGAVGGEGIAGYLFGDIQAASVVSPTSIVLLENVGGYVAFQQVLSRTSETENLTANIAYGMVDSEAVVASENAQLQQAWCNLLWNANDSVALGLEYQYGHRLIEDRSSGDNHRFSFVVEFTTSTAREVGERMRSSLSREEGKRPLQYRRL